MKHKVLFLTGVVLLTLTSVSCKKEVTFEERLKSIEGISNVTAINPKEPVEGIKHYYSFDIKQCLDWNNPTLATFNQRASIYYVSDTAPTEYYVNGYTISNNEPSDLLKFDEFFDRYKCNIVQIEYRFFKHSQPNGFDPEGTQYYEYMNSFQASKDFHNVITSMKTILKGSTIFSGGSKGGYTTEAMAYYYPDDIDSYVSYVAPLCDGDNDNRIAEYVYTTIGDKGFPAGKGAEYRAIVSTFQRNALDEKFREAVMKHLSIEKTETLSKDEIYEITVYNFAIGMWQYHTDFDDVKAINDMPETTGEEIADKAYAMALRINPKIKKNEEENENDFLPYYVQAKLEMGNYSTNLDYLRNAKMNIKTAKERDALLTDLTCLTQKQIQTFKYSPDFRKTMINFLNTTKKEIVKIVGLNDPWYAVKDPVTENTNIHLYEVSHNHLSRINQLDETKANEVWSIVDRLVKKA